jgi:hypothetical protein
MTQNAATVDPVAILVTSMVFGYGGNSYGPDRVYTMLETPNVEQCCDEIFAAAQDGPENGFAALYEDKMKTRVTNLGASMGSKYLYFGSSSLMDSSRSLINDENVFHAMRALGFDDSADPELAYTEQYVRAVRWMHKAAVDVNNRGDVKRSIGGDDVEFALFQYANWKRRSDRLEGIEARERR